jgi:hypothetical protein
LSLIEQLKLKVRDGGPYVITAKYGYGIAIPILQLRELSLKGGWRITYGFDGYLIYDEVGVLREWVIAYTVECNDELKDLVGKELPLGGSDVEVECVVIP